MEPAARRRPQAMSLEPSPTARLQLPADVAALRTLRHDLRMPINPILGFCELIVDEAGAAAPRRSWVGCRRCTPLANGC